MRTLAKAFGLEGKVALITGGGSGLGLAMARCMAEAGASVALVGRRAEVLDEACQRLNGQATAWPFDLSDPSCVGELAQRVSGHYGHIDILVNNAGNQIKKPALELSVEEFNVQLTLHLSASFALTQAVLPGMLRARGGSVIFLSSMTSAVGLTNVAGYAVAKSGVMGLVRSFASEYSHSGVRFNALMPGFIDTPMFRKATETDPKRREKILARTPMDTFGDPEDIGWAAVYLASPAARFVTGTNLPVDGGALIGF